jgi:hypothetical protein
MKEVPDETLDRTAISNFERARVKAGIARVIAALKRQRNSPLTMADVATEEMHFSTNHYDGLSEVPIKQIAGTVNRSHDFDRNFNPTQEHTRNRWVRINMAMLRGERLPPVRLYKVGDRYFVKDGNHRVSVARQLGAEYIDAEVCELGLSPAPDAQPEMAA